MEHACYNRWSAKIKIYQLINQKTRPYNILFSLSFEYSWMSQIWGSHGHCLFYLRYSLDYECSNLIYQTHWLDRMQCSGDHKAWKVNKTDQQFLIKWCCQLACDGDKVIALSKRKGMPNLEHWGNNLIIVSRHWSSLPEEKLLQWQ